MTEVARQTCLNCDTELSGRFCPGCGQRVLPPNPSLRELARDAWDELAGYDGRFARTIRLLLAHPGRLTTAVVDGQRARYISPVRLYLFASFVFFLIAALAPPLATRGSMRAGIISDSGEERVVDIDAAQVISPEARAAWLQELEQAPWWANALLRPMFSDPAGFRRRLTENTPRVLFVLVPVFALAVGLFFRTGWLRHVVFSLHVHAAAFLLLVPRELARFSGSVYVLGATEVVTLLIVIPYILAGAKRVYAEPWGWLLIKAIPVALVYAMAYVFALLIAVAWTAAG